MGFADRLIRIDHLLWSRWVNQVPCYSDASSRFRSTEEHLGKIHGRNLFRPVLNLALLLIFIKLCLNPLQLNWFFMFLHRHEWELRFSYWLQRLT